MSKNFDSPQSLGRKVKFFSPLGFEPKSTFSHKTCKLKSQPRAHKLYLNEKSLIYGQETASIFSFIGETLKLDFSSEKLK